MYQDVTRRITFFLETHYSTEPLSPSVHKLVKLIGVLRKDKRVTFDSDLFHKLNALHFQIRHCGSIKSNRAVSLVNEINAILGQKYPAE